MTARPRPPSVLRVYALFLSYRLRETTAAEHAELCEQLAPAFAAVSGLVSMTWLANGERGRFGAFCVFADRPAFDGFVASELYEALRSHRGVAELATNDFSIQDGPTALTRGPTSLLAHL